MAADQQEQKQEETMPSISNTSNLPVQEPEQQVDNVKRKRTKLDEVINEAWGYGGLDGDAFDSIIKYADPEMAKKSKTGFEMDLLKGGKISWTPPSQQDPNERISCPSKKFDQDAAAAMVALARLHGWKTLNVHGTVEQKEMLWLAVQRQNLLEKEAFERDQKSGKIPQTEKDKDGKDVPVTFTPLSVANFMPLADSKIFQQWQQEDADYKAKHAVDPKITENKEPPPAPDKKPDAPDAAEIEKKEQLWLDTQRRNVRDKIIFELALDRARKSGDLSKYTTRSGELMDKYVPLTPLELGDFKPAPDSKVFLEWQKEEPGYTARAAEYEAHRAEYLAKQAEKPVVPAPSSETKGDAAEIEKKEQLWLDTQRRNLRDKIAFEREQKRTPLNSKFTSRSGERLEYTPAIPEAIKNFQPEADSKVFQQWQKEEPGLKAQWNAVQDKRDQGFKHYVKKMEEKKPPAPKSKKKHDGPT